MSNDKRPNYREGAKQLAKNVAVAGVGSAAGYAGGGLLAKNLLKNRTFRRRLSNMTKAERDAFLNKVRMGGALAGSAAGGLSAYALSKSLEKEKTAEFFVNYAYRRLV